MPGNPVSDHETSSPTPDSLPMDGREGRMYDNGMEAAMIELTEQQLPALENADPGSTRFVNPRTRETFVLVRAR